MQSLQMQTLQTLLEEQVKSFYNEINAKSIINSIVNENNSALKNIASNNIKAECIKLLKLKQNEFAKFTSKQFEKRRANKMKKLILCFSFLMSFLICTNEAAANEPNSPPIQQEKMFFNNVGFTGSMFSGGGMHYLLHLNEKSAVKLVFMGWSEQNETTSIPTQTTNPDAGDVFINFGLEYRHTLIREGKHSVYGMAGGGFWYSEDIERNYNSRLSRISNSDVLQNRYSFGFGLGYEYRIAKRIALSVELGWAGNYTIGRKWQERQDPTESWKDYNRSVSKRLGIGGGTSIGFIF